MNAMLKTAAAMAKRPLAALDRAPLPDPPLPVPDGPGALDVPLGAPEVPLPVALAAAPVGRPKPWKLPVTGPGAAVAAAPDPLRAGVGTVGTVPLSAVAAANMASQEPLPATGALIVPTIP